MNEEQIAKAKEAKSAEELLALAKEFGIEDFTEKNAEELFQQLHSSGEMTDEELENVVGGCSVKVNGKQYTVVTCDTKCKCGQYYPVYDYSLYDEDREFRRTDSFSLRKSWYDTAVKGERCGNCFHLAFKHGMGYCEIL